MQKRILTQLPLAGKVARSFQGARQRRLDVMASWVGTPDPGTKWIPTASGHIVIVDEQDYEALNQWNWYVSGRGYAIRSVSHDKWLLMHREIMNTPADMHTDHINRQPLDNRRCNLRICTNQQNNFNKPKERGAASSRFKGVTKHKHGWISRMTIKGNILYFGIFKTEEEAALRYNEAAKRHFGEFACLNVI